MLESRLQITSVSWSGTVPRPLAAICLAATLFTSGCLFKKTPAAHPFVPPPVQPAVVKPVATVDPPPELDATLTPSVVPEPFPAGAALDPQIPAPPKPAPPKPRSVPTPTLPKPPTETPPAQPRITQIFTPQELRDYNRTYTESMTRIDRALNNLARKTLTPPDRETVNQIRSFQTQAKQAKDQDLVAAVSFARKADVLAKDLLDRLR